MPRSIAAEPEILEAGLDELMSSVRELRCSGMAGLMRGDVSMGQLHVLWLLDHHGTLSMTALAELLGISLSNATGLMDRMEERGLIERLRESDDRRRVLIRPAPGGRLALEQVEGMRRDRMRSILGRMNERALRQFVAGLRDFRRAVRDEAADAPGAPAHRHYFTDGA